MQEDSRGVKVDRDRRKVLEGAGYDGRCPRTEENQRDVETNAQCRARGSGGQIGEEVEPEDVEGDWERQSDGDGVAYDGRRCRMDGATSGARGDSKRVDTRSLAEVRSSQQERRQRTMAHVPEPSTPLPNDPKRPTNPPNPPRRRGRLKTRPRRVSPAGSRKSTHQAIWSRRDHIGRVGYVVYVVYGQEMAQERSRGHETRRRGAGVDRGRPRIPGTARI